MFSEGIKAYDITKLLESHPAPTGHADAEVVAECWIIYVH